MHAVAWARDQLSSSLDQESSLSSGLHFVLATAKAVSPNTLARTNAEQSPLHPGLRSASCGWRSAPHGVISGQARELACGNLALGLASRHRSKVAACRT